MPDLDVPLIVSAASWAVLPAWIVACAGVLFFYRRDIHRLLREPVWRFPVLVLDSDDWGAGPLVQARALDDLASVLRKFRDASGRPPVLSLAVVLAGPDGAAIAADASTYRRICLDEASLRPVLDALIRGRDEGLFSLQLHGLEHFWPETLMASADPVVRAWLRSPSVQSTESLAAHLQSRWADTRQLPSVPLDDDAVREAAAEEVHAFRRVFGQVPDLVVPPTFLWTPVVERAWASEGVVGIVTPGERYVARDRHGDNIADQERFANGDRAGAVTYLVRYDYFEPARGRDARYALNALSRAIEEGRPCILENHRTNFTADPAVNERSLRELEGLIAGALSKWSKLRFLSSSEAHRALRQRDPEWLCADVGQRLPALWHRLRRSGRLWKLIKIMTVSLPVTWVLAAMSYE